MPINNRYGHNSTNNVLSASNRVFITPEHIRAVAHLYGHETEKVNAARVLVLGCREGLDLLPYANKWPMATVVAVELASENYFDKHKVLSEVAPKNLHLLSLNLPDLLNVDIGCFDYIIISNSFSMLSSDLTDAILEYSDRHLNEQGVIVFDWWCLPGIQTRQTVRDSILLHASLAESLNEQIATAKTFLAAMYSSIDEHGPVKNAYYEELMQANLISDDLFEHHFLSPTYSDSYLIDFNARIEKIGLEYIGDLKPNTETPEFYDDMQASLQNAMAGTSNKVLQQQYLDFSTNRKERLSILAKKNTTLKISNTPNYEKIKDFSWAGSFRRSINANGNVENKVFSHDGKSVIANDTVTLGILDILSEAWPNSLTFEQLLFHTRLPDVHNEQHEQKVLISLKTLLLSGIELLHFVLNDDVLVHQGKKSVHVASWIKQQMKFDPHANTFINEWGQLVLLTPKELAYAKLDKIELREDTLSLFDLYRCKGILQGTFLGWKEFYSEAIKIADLNSIPGYTSALLLYSSDKSACGLFSENEIINDVSDPLEKNGFTLPISAEDASEIDSLVVAGQHQKATERLNSLLVDVNDSIHLFYYLYRHYKRVGNNKTATKMLAKVLSYNTTSLFIYSEMAFLLCDINFAWHCVRLSRAILRCDMKSSPEWYLLGRMHKDNNDYEKAERCARAAYKLAPESKLITGLLCFTLCEQAKTDEGIALLRKSIKNIYTDYSFISQLAFLLTHSSTSTAEEVQNTHLDFGKGVEKWAEKFRREEENMPMDCFKEKLRIGFVSGDFRHGHSVDYFFRHIWNSLDRNLFDIYAYNNTPINVYNEGTLEYRKRSDKWYDVQNMSDVELYDSIKNDKIDILVDLSGHTANNRLCVFALKPAPVQISWVGYHGSTGLKAVDYYATIFPVKPSAELEAQFVEKIIYFSLSRNFQPAQNCPEIVPLPAFKNSYFTFGSFNRSNKINDNVIDTWSQIINSIPNSKMIIGSIPRFIWKDILKKFQLRGVDTERIELKEPTSLISYLEYHNGIDIMLDTFPFTGGAITSHAAWMGVPTISLTGDTLVSRQGEAIMYSLGLEDFIASNTTDYIRKAIYWSENRSRLQNIRLSMRELMSVNSKYNEKISKLVTEMFTTCWNNYLSGKEATSFTVDINS
jgi:predicted O-linked N-acetylglucosamine transferase (SPINDLY family)